MYALVIAGGQGERLRPLTNDRPKPMVEVAGKPILAYQVEWLRQQGVGDIVICCGYRADVMQRYFDQGQAWGVRIQYSIEAEPLGRGGALKLGYRLVPPEEEVVIGLNGDNITTQPLAPFLRYHRRRRAAATVMLTPLRSPYGIVRMARGGRIQAFLEKPQLSHWINAGIYLLSPEFFRRLPDRGDHETTVFPQLSAEGVLFGYRSRAYWRTVDTMKDLSEAEGEVRQLALV
ncbi:MAG TPA: nucleotidyltransferase family protein [Dehalococcoidia bacterium]|nr:nucleotidyltransferase family protein [Dehalococcoidia bacterium]